MFQRRRARLAAGRIADPETIAVIASAVRQELIDALEALGGTATIVELAEQLGRPADGLYYHVELLCRAGLFVLAPGPRSRTGRSERRYRLPPRAAAPLGLRYEPRNVSAVRGVVASMLRIARRDFDRAITSDREVAVDGLLRELWASRGTGWVSDTELAELNRLLVRLIGLLRRPRGGMRRHLVSLCFVLAPMPARPRRRPAVERSPAATERRARRPRAGSTPLRGRARSRP
jgi:hypothetical protein